MKFLHFSSRAIVLAIAMCLSVMSQAQEFDVNGIFYYLTGDNTAAVTYPSYGTYSGTITIPSEVTATVYPMYEEPYETTVKVTAIGSYAFENCTGVTEVNLPSTITEIGNGAFYGCTGLTGINLPNSLYYIGESAFSNSGLRSISIPESVYQLGWNVFYSCESLTEVTLPNSITSLLGTFRFCTALTTINIPSSVTLLNNTFAGCTSLKDITIPNSVTLITNQAFYNCDGLKDITCLSLTPARVNHSDCFYSVLDLYANTLLHVPAEAIDAYRNADVWKLFNNIIGFGENLPGDMNGDGEVNIADINAIISNILSSSQDLHYDINGDGEVNIADVTAIIDIILS